MFEEDLAGFLAEGPDFGFSEFGLLGFVGGEFIDDIIKINFFCLHMEKMVNFFNY